MTLPVNPNASMAEEVAPISISIGYKIKVASIKTDAMINRSLFLLYLGFAPSLPQPIQPQIAAPIKIN